MLHSTVNFFKHVKFQKKLFGLGMAAERKKAFNLATKTGFLTVIVLLQILYVFVPMVTAAKENRHKNIQLNSEELTQTSLTSSQVDFLSGTWQGTYICPQGLTNIKLVISAKNENNIDAVFMFYANSNNQTVPSGSFRMKGILLNLNSPDIPNTLELKATRWISRPSGYLTVDLQGNILPSQDRIVGNVLNASGCSNFDVTKVRN